MNKFNKFATDFSTGFKVGYQNPHRLPMYWGMLKLHWYAAFIKASYEAKHSIEKQKVPQWALGIVHRACAVHDKRINWATKKFNGIVLDGWMDFGLEALKAHLSRQIRRAERG